MVRTTDLNTRLSLASLVSSADLPCKRLFLDYHGLKILQNWMSSLGWTSEDLDLKLEMEAVLKSLNIPHRTMLNESKVWNTISHWAEATPENEQELLLRLSRPSSPKESAAAASAKIFSPALVSVQKAAAGRKEAEKSYLQRIIFGSHFSGKIG